ncbi:MAG: glycosyltransferase family 4 protein [Burkholderiales bacterium]|jgi:glycosyltransferase involved in cell wall biosynthesis
MFRRTLHPSLPPVGTVCLCANTSWYLVNFRSRLIDALLADGWDVVTWAPEDDHAGRLRSRGARHVRMELDNASTRPLRELGTLAGFARTLGTMQPDVVLSWTPKVNVYAALAARLLRVPTIANVSGLGRSFGSGGRLEAISRVLYRASMGWPSTVFFQNEEDRTAFVSAGWVDPARTFRLPGSGVDVERFVPAAGTPGRRFRFLMAARLLWAKGVAEYVEAARIVRRSRPDVEFALAGFVGDGGEQTVPRARIDAWVGEGVIRFLGQVDDMVPVYADSDCVVLPSFYREGVPRTLLEAASMGLPVITTDSVGCRDAVVPGVTGWRVPPRDVPALVDAMQALLHTDAAGRARIGAAARARALAEFDERHVIAAYRSAIGAAARRPVAEPVG